MKKMTVPAFLVARKQDLVLPITFTRQGALQTGHGRSSGEVQVRVGL